MITELSAQNFKSWTETGKIQFAPLTGFFGANNSGKTSLLQTLLLFKQTVERPQADLWDDSAAMDDGGLYPLNWIEPLYFGDNASLVNLGDFNTVVHRHKADLNLFFSLSWKTVQPQRINGQQIANTFSFSTSIVKRGRDSALESFRYTADESDFDIMHLDGAYRFVNSMTQVTPFRCYGIIDPTEDLSHFVVLREVFEKLFSQIHPLSPLREYPKDRYPWGRRLPRERRASMGRKWFLHCLRDGFSSFLLMSRFLNGYRSSVLLTPMIFFLSLTREENTSLSSNSTKGDLMFG